MARKNSLAVADKSGGTEGALARTTPVQLSGPQKALVLLLSLDDSAASKIVGHMKEHELRALKQSTDELAEVDAKTIVQVHREFAELLRQGAPASLEGSEGYLRKLAGKAFGERRADEFWEDDGGVSGLVTALADLDVTSTRALLDSEHPQTIAVVLSQLPSDRAGKILEAMAEERQVEVVTRLARLENVPEAVMEDLEKHFQQEVAGLGDGRKRDVHGKKVAANILKMLKPEISDALLDELGADDDELAESIRQQLFTFEDLHDIDDRGLQVLLKEVSTDQLVLSLKTASDRIKERFFGNVSSRAAQMLQEELEFMGPVKVAEVEAAQQAIVQSALALQRDGRIQIASTGGGDLV